MDIDLGIVVRATDEQRAGVATGLARLAEERGLDLVVVDAASTQGTLDPWTLAAWLAGATKRIGIGIDRPLPPAPDPTDSTAPYPSVIERARESLERIARGRVMTDASAWVVASADADAATLADLAARDGLPVVVPVSSREELERVASFVPDRSGAKGRRRSAAARARRVAGIDYDGVPESLAETAVEPGDAEYASVASTYLRGGQPGLVLRPRTPEEVADALAFASRHPDLPLGIRSAGHGISGRSTNKGGIVIDVGAMDSIEVLDVERRLVRIGPGATWKRVAAALAPYGWALGSGDYGGVGVGGLATAGGIGFLSRKHGLTIDHLRAVELVVPDGRLVRATATENADLFWAVRGAGANFGIVTAFEFEVSEVGAVGWAQLMFVTDDLERSLRRYGELASTAPRDTTVFLVTGQPRQGMAQLQLYGMVDNPDADTVVARLTPFLELGMLAEQQVVMTSYESVMAMAADVGPEGQHGYGEPHSRSAFLDELTPEFARDAAEMLSTGAVHFFQLRAMGGAIADVEPDATAFAFRTPAFHVTAMGARDDRLNRAWAPLRRHTEGLYLSFETERTPQTLRDAFPPRALDRLRELKRRYDPHNLLRDNFNIDPADAPSLASDQTPTEAIA